jgi:hypothetical protein
LKFQNTAIGLTADAVPPLIRNGAMVSRKSLRRDVQQHSARKDPVLLRHVRQERSPEIG